MLTVSDSAMDIATQVSEYDRRRSDPNVLYVDGIGPIAQYHNYVDCAVEKGLQHFVKDYQQHRLNSKCFIKKTTMPPKNHYTAPRAISWADLTEEEEENSKEPEAQRLEREDNTPYNMPKFVSHVPYAIQQEAKPSFENANPYGALIPTMPPLPPEPPRPGRAPSVSSGTPALSLIHISEPTRPC